MQATHPLVRPSRHLEYDMGHDMSLAVWALSPHARHMTVLDCMMHPDLRVDFTEFDAEPSLDFAHRVHTPKYLKLPTRQMAAQVSAAPAAYPVLDQKSLAVELWPIPIFQQQALSL